MLPTLHCLCSDGQVSSYPGTEAWEAWNSGKQLYSSPVTKQLSPFIIFVLTFVMFDLGGVVAIVSATLPLFSSPLSWFWLRSASRARSCGTVMVLFSPWRASRSWSTWAGDCVSLSRCPVTRPKGQRDITSAGMNISWDQRWLNILNARPWRDQMNMILHRQEDAYLSGLGVMRIIESLKTTKISLLFSVLIFIGRSGRKTTTDKFIKMKIR